MGPFDNTAHCYVEDNNVEDGLWVTDEEGNLWIIPTAGDEIYGPDGKTLDKLNALCREHPIPDYIPGSNLAALGLSVVPAVLKRFDRDNGYYYA